MAARWTNRDLAAVTVLALLLHGPRHPYEIHRTVIDTHKDYLTGAPRSIYHAVDRLRDAGLIAVHGSDRAGSRPERTIYALTDEGRAELSARVRRLLEHVDADATVLHVAVSLLMCLPPRDVVRALRTRAATLQGRVAEADAVLAGLADAGLPQVLLLEVSWDRARHRAELDWVQGLVADIRDGTLAWEGGSGPPDAVGAPGAGGVAAFAGMAAATGTAAVTGAVDGGRGRR